MGVKGKWEEKEKILWDEWKQKDNIPNLWNVAKVVIRGNVIAINIYIKKEERSQISNVSFQGQTKPKVNRGKE